MGKSSNSCGVHVARFLKLVYPFFNIMHERVNWWKWSFWYEYLTYKQLHLMFHSLGFSNSWIPLKKLMEEASTQYEVVSIHYFSLLFFVTLLFNNKIGGIYWVTYTVCISKLNWVIVFTTWKPFTLESKMCRQVLNVIS